MTGLRWRGGDLNLRLNSREQAMAEEKERIVCVTGASGFLASWLVKRLLERGYHVRGTVRDPDNLKKTSHLWELPGAKERLQLLKADLLTEGIFDSVVDGCEGVFHTASPVMMTAKDPQTEIVEPALLGTLNVLKACKNSSTVKRVVLTSSASTLRYTSDSSPDSVFDESAWSSTEICRKKKMWYALAKTLAEKAAWDFAKSNNLDLVTVVPSFIVGYVLPTVPTASAADALTLLKGSTEKFEIFKHMGYVHLDDVASAHILVYEDQNASGRYICSAADATNTEIAEFLAKRYPQYNIPTKFEAFEPFYKGYSSKKLEALGFQFKSLEQMFDDCVESFKHKGLL